MSLVHAGSDARFARPSEVIERLKATRTILSMDTTDFLLFGAAEFAEAAESGVFVKNNAKAALYVMVGNSSSQTITEHGLGSSNVNHAIDIVLYLRAQDARGQRSDQVSVWFKEYLVRSLMGHECYSGSQPLMFGGDQFNSLQGTEGYLRTYQFTQTVYINGEDLIGDGDADNLPYLLQIYSEIYPDD